ncbi:hypothetical protein CH380_02280 [Leptospira adleri]|uniref:Uncharacterized protein n=1 Tax=Leptospira adleri TaxID=2023186 RepID=A0A2M9YST6_9LEPT|nr:hypothetical protein CH380_02280 [Leptospira adleri]
MLIGTSVKSALRFREFKKARETGLFYLRKIEEVDSSRRSSDLFRAIIGGPTQIGWRRRARGKTREIFLYQKSCMLSRRILLVGVPTFFVLSLAAPPRLGGGGGLAGKLGRLFSIRKVACLQEGFFLSEFRPFSCYHWRPHPDWVEEAGSRENSGDFSLSEKLHVCKKDSSRRSSDRFLLQKILI